MIDAFPEPILEILLSAMLCVESARGETSGDGGAAHGRLMIHQAMLDDIRQRFGLCLSLEDMDDLGQAKRAARLYWRIWATPELLGHVPTLEDLARIHNGGPDGWSEHCTDRYWSEVRSHLPAHLLPPEDSA
jgi:hypothetical protein